MYLCTFQCFLDQPFVPLQAENDRVFDDIQKMKEKEAKEFEAEKERQMV